MITTINEWKKINEAPLIDVNDDEYKSIMSNRNKKEGYYIDDVGIKTIIPNDTKELNVSSKNLVELVCNSELEKLWCYNNQLTNLKLNDKLETLYCFDNQLTELIINDNLKELFCADNQLTQLKLNDKLETLKCFNNQLTNLTLNDKLEVLDCSYNKLTKLTLNDKLEQLYCDKNIKLIGNTTGIKINESKEKDINNDGKVDDQDSYLKHKRNTITKAIKKQNENSDSYNTDFISSYNKCIVLKIDDINEDRMDKFDIIRMIASDNNCEIIGTNENNIYVDSKSGNEDDLRRFINEL